MLCLCVVVSGVRLVPGRLFVIFIFSLVCILKLLLHLVIVLVFTLRCLLVAGDETPACLENSKDAGQRMHLVAKEEHQLENVDKEAHNLDIDPETSLGE